MELEIQAKVNSYVSLTSRINYGLLFNKLSRFRNKRVLLNLNDRFPECLSTTSEQLER
jgi:hypothetical protein